MPDRLFFTQANNAFTVTPMHGARAYFYAEGTTTQVAVTDAAGNTLVQPILSLSNGGFPQVYGLPGVVYTVLVTDANGVALPGYPIDGVVPLASDLSAANSVPIAPIEGLAGASNVQAALEALVGLTGEEATSLYRTTTIWTTSGTAPAYTLTPTPAVTAYVTGMQFNVAFHASNVGEPTINISGLGARAIKRFDVNLQPAALADGTMKPGYPIPITFDGTQFIAEPKPITIGNANGRCIRLPSGDQFCWHVGAEMTTDTAIGAGFRSANETWTFPLAFTAAPTVVCGAIRSNTSVGAPWAAPAAVDSGVTTTTAVGQLYGWTNTSRGRIQWFAVGR